MLFHLPTPSARSSLWPISFQNCCHHPYLGTCTFAYMDLHSSPLVSMVSPAVTMSFSILSNKIHGWTNYKSVFLPIYLSNAMSSPTQPSLTAWVWVSLRMWGKKFESIWFLFGKSKEVGSQWATVERVLEMVQNIHLRAMSPVRWGSWAVGYVIGRMLIPSCFHLPPLQKKPSRTEM